MRWNQAVASRLHHPSDRSVQKISRYVGLDELLNYCYLWFL